MYKRKKYLSLLIFAALVYALCVPNLYAGTTNQDGGTKEWWPSDAQWISISGLNDGTDVGTPRADRLDFVGTPQYPGGYYYADSNYLYFRSRVHTTPVTGSTYADSTFVYIDRVGWQDPYNTSYEYAPDYAINWDSKGVQNAHGIEFQVYGNSNGVWSGTNMADLDGDNGQKVTPDINVRSSGEGYIRTVDGQSYTDGATTTFIDYAVSWAYLTGIYSGNTITKVGSNDVLLENGDFISTLRPGQTWLIQFGSMRGQNDHGSNYYDIAGGDSPSSALNAGSWSDPITAGSGISSVNGGSANASEVTIVTNNQATVLSVTQYGSISEKTLSINMDTGILSITKKESFTSIPQIQNKSVIGIGMLVDFTQAGYDALIAYLSSNNIQLQDLLSLTINNNPYTYGQYNYDFVDSTYRLSVWVPLSPALNTDYTYLLKMLDYFDIFHAVSGYDSNLSSVISNIGGDLVYGPSGPPVPEPATVISILGGMLLIVRRRAFRMK